MEGYPISFSVSLTTRASLKFSQRKETMAKSTSTVTFEMVEISDNFEIMVFAHALHLKF